MTLDNFIELAEQYAQLSPEARAAVRAAATGEKLAVESSIAEHALEGLVAASTDPAFDESVQEALAELSGEEEEEDDEIPPDEDEDDEEDDDEDEAE